MIQEGKKMPAVDEFLVEMKQMWDTVKEAMQKVAKKMKEQYDRRKKPSREYQIGDKVYLDATNVPTLRPTKKLDQKYYGPYQVKGKVGESSY
jgi:nucleoid DNA-binding protein